MSECYKNDFGLDRIVAERIPCPYCLNLHKTLEADWNSEDTYWAYMECPEVGKVRITFEFMDKSQEKHRRRTE